MSKAFHEQRLFPDDLPLLLMRSKEIEFLAHWQNEIELLFVREGRQVLGINHQTFILEAGQAAFIAPNDIHYYHGPGTSLLEQNLVEPGQGECCMLFFPPDLISPLSTNRSMIWHPMKKEVFKEIYDLIKKLEQITSAQEPYFALQGRGILQILIATLFRQESALLHENALISPSDSDTQMPQVLTYLNSQFNRCISRDQIAEQFGFSPAHFSRVFKATTGLPFSVYLRQLRIQKACNLLQQSKLSVTEIALSCGFESIRTFNRAFRQYAGCQPTSLRLYKR